MLKSKVESMTKALVDQLLIESSMKIPSPLKEVGSEAAYTKGLIPKDLTPPLPSPPRATTDQPAPEGGKHIFVDLEKGESPSKVYGEAILKQMDDNWTKTSSPRDLV